MNHDSRRNFLSKVATTTAAAAIGSAFGNFSGRIRAEERIVHRGFGELLETADATTGLPLIKLPEGFRYVSFGWTNEPMSDGAKTPGAHDGMAVIDETGDEVVLCRNHEVGSIGKAFGPSEMCYDSQAAGGCTNLIFNRKLQKFTSARPSLTGTLKNCAGGATPWGTWLSCEETVVDSTTRLDGEKVNSLTKPHGFVFEVPVGGQSHPRPIESLGRFVHEAVSIDPATGIVYLTEDASTAGFYRLIPTTPGNLQAGGKFQMLAAKQSQDVRRGVKPDAVFDVKWVDIADPVRPHSPGTEDGLGVYSQGKQLGGLTFARLEGCAVHSGKVFITATSGGDAQAGQVWQYDPVEEQLKLVFESPSADVLDMPDNLAVSPRGGILLCEDGNYQMQRLQVLTTDGILFPLAVNNVQLDGLHGHRGDFRSSEWAGATFTADGEWLFVNIQTPGVTLAITGPWRAGLI